MCSPCLSASASIHPPTHPYISFRILLNFSFLLCATAHALEVDVSSVHMHCDEWRLSVPSIKKCWSYMYSMSQLHVRSTPSSKCTPPGEFPGYWWLFQTQHLLRNGARLAEERIWTILIFDRFRFATLKQLLHTAITTADWRRLYELLYE